MIDPNDLADAEESAKILNVHVETIRRWNRKGLLPAAVEIGGVKRYSKLALLDAATLPESEKAAADKPLLDAEAIAQVIEALKPIVEDEIAKARAKRGK